jgi:ubiquinone/menaquinone biosynthesis C-methylase UbiE
MEAYNYDEVKNCYNFTAKQYSDRFCNELDGKPFDCSVLNRFAKTVKANGLIIEFATGSGHIADYLYKCGLKKIQATDITEESINIATKKYPNINFGLANMLKTQFEDNSINGIVCFYGIVHFTYKEIDEVLNEWKRILRIGGRALFSFHIGNDESLRVESFLDNENAKATWNFFNVDKVLELMEKNGIVYDEVVIRYPYLEKEHPSKRCYIQFINQ